MQAGNTDNPKDLNLKLKLAREFTPLDLAKLRLLVASTEYTLEVFGMSVELQRHQLEEISSGAGISTSTISENQLGKLKADQGVFAAAVAFVREHEKVAALEAAKKKAARTPRSQSPRARGAN